MSLHDEIAGGIARLLTRRQLLARCPLGLGAVALAALGRDGDPRPGPLSPRPPHHAPRAKSVIYLHMAGSPPQHDTFDGKPELQRLGGTPCPAEFIEGKRLAFIRGHPKLLASPYRFAPCGDHGLLVSELLPFFRQIVDDVCVVRSMHTDEFNHAPAQLFLYTGSRVFGAASMGSWVTYGLGSQNQNLPGFVVMISGGTDPSGGKSLWGSGYLPSVYQATQIRAGHDDPVFYLGDPPGLTRTGRRDTLDALHRLNELEHQEVGDPEILSRIEQYELAFRMQTEVPDVMDIRRESPATLAAYGAEPGKTSFANNCLLARRLVERGVRFVQLFDWGWDVHGTGRHDDLLFQLPAKCLATDRPIAALIKDLKSRGLLDETLVVCGGEFGRTPMNEARNGSTFLGRDHHPDCFTIWLAGGGVRPGQVRGATDELGYAIAEHPTHVRDLQATVLHLLGLDPYLLHYEFMGLRQRLIGPTDQAHILHSLL